MTAVYLYDAAGNRIKKVVTRGPVTESTVYIDGVYEYFKQTRPVGDIEQNTLHVTAGNGRVATIRVGTALPDDATPATKYIIGDHLQTSTIVIDNTGSWVNREEYSPYGETVLGSYARKRYRYAGRERDEESGLDYSRARYYAPWLGRWISPDPLTIQTLGSSLTPYVYVGGSPVNAADPSGLDDGAAHAETSTQGTEGGSASDASAGSATPNVTAHTNAIDGGAQPTPTGGAEIEYTSDPTPPRGSTVADSEAGFAAGVVNPVVAQVREQAHNAIPNLVTGGPLNPAGALLAPRVRTVTDQFMGKRIDDFFDKLTIDVPDSPAGVYAYIAGSFFFGVAQSVGLDMITAPGALPQAGPLELTPPVITSPSADAVQAGLRGLLNEGQYAKGFIDATGPRVSEYESETIQLLGDEFGCHSCGTIDPGQYGTWIGDHQPATALVNAGIRDEPQILVPHCESCSNKQSKAVLQELAKYGKGQ